MTKLVIDTTDKSETVIKLEGYKKVDEVKSQQKTKSQEALILIDKILRKNRMKPKNISAVEVNTGPGSFTGTRVGVAIANALGFCLDVPVNGKKSELSEPKYF